MWTTYLLIKKLNVSKISHWIDPDPFYTKYLTHKSNLYHIHFPISPPHHRPKLCSYSFDAATNTQRLNVYIYIILMELLILNKEYVY